jgi:hypothetical protein
MFILPYKNGGKGKELSIKLGDVFVALQTDDSALQQGLNNAKGSVTSWASNLQSNITGLVGGAVVANNGVSLWWGRLLK